MKQKKFFMIMIFVLGMMLIPGENYAVLQANPNTHGTKKDTPKNWMTNIRNMETANQAMGLEETIDATTKGSTSKSNGIDVHMLKTTEYGGVAILSASGYGNPKWIQNSTIKSTTGNKSGVYFNLQYENTAGGLSKKIFSGINPKYYDAYEESITSAKVGDALGNSATENPGCAMWHDAPLARWIEYDYPCFVRGGPSVFGYSIGSESSAASGAYIGRAAVICGAGF